MHGLDVVDPTGGELGGQVGIGQQLAAHGHEVGLAVGEQLLGLVGLVAAVGDDRHVDDGADPSGVLRERAGPVGCVGVGGTGARVGIGVGGEVHRGGPGVDRPPDDLALLLEGLRVGFDVLDGVDAHPHREVGAGPCPDGADHLEQHPGPVLERAAPAVVARVAR